MSNRWPRPQSSERGAALILVIIVASLLIILAAEATSVATTEWEASQNADLELRLDYALKAGLEIAKAHILDDAENSPETDTLLEPWCSTEGITKDLDPNTLAPGLVPNPEDSGDSIKLRIFIEDEERKWPLGLLTLGNDAQKERRKEGLYNVLDTFRKETRADLLPDQAQLFADAISAFINRKEGDTGFGPTPRPLSKSGLPLDIVDLSLIPGLPQDLLFDQIDPEDGTIIPGLMHSLTLWSDLRINVNTSSEAVLRGLFRRNDSDAIVGSNIYFHRTDKSKEFEEKRDLEDRLRGENRESRERQPAEPRPGSSEDPEEELGSGAFESVDDVKRDVNTVTDRLFTEIRNNLTVTSKVFTIYVEAKAGSIKKVRRYVVRREDARFVLILSQLVRFPRFRPVSETEAAEDQESEGI